MINDDAPAAEEPQSDRDLLHALSLNDDELQRVLGEETERFRSLLHVVTKDSPAVEVIPIVAKLSRTSAMSLLVSENVLVWLIQTTYVFDFAAWDIELLQDLLSASACLLSQPNLPPASLAAVSGSYINVILDIALEHVEDEETDVLNAALSCLFSVNIHERRRDTSRTISLISSKKETVELGNAILAYVNRTGNPAGLDFVGDLLSETTTTDFFFTNDLRVLIDIIIRGLLDLEPDHPSVDRLLTLVLILSRTHEKTLREHKFAELRGVLQRLVKQGNASPVLQQFVGFFEL